MLSSDFIAIIKLLQDLDFDFLSMSQIANMAKTGFVHTKHWTHLSFDDGYQNIYTDILPYLERSGIPYSLFVSTHHVETGQRFPTFVARYAYLIGKDLSDIFGVKAIASASQAEALLKFSPVDAHEERVHRILSLLTEDEVSDFNRYVNERPLDISSLKRISRQHGAHIGSHMHHHWIFHEKQPAASMREDLDTSLQRLTQDWQVSERPAFCYPNGNFDAYAISLLKDRGIEIGLTSQSGFVDRSTHPLLMPRFTMTNVTRALAICILCVLGNSSLRLFGRSIPSLPHKCHL